MKQYVSMVKDVREAIERILPIKNREKTVEFIQDHINETKVQQKLDDGTYTLQDIYEFGNFTLERIKELDSKQNEDSIDQQIKWLDQEIKNTQQNPKQLFPSFICDLFKDIFDRLDMIESIKHSIFSDLTKK